MKTTFKALENLGFTYKKGNEYNNSEAYIETSDGYITLTKDGNDDFRITIEAYYIGKPLNTIERVKNVLDVLYGLKI